MQIEGLTIRELPSRLSNQGYDVTIWEEEESPESLVSCSCRMVFPGIVEAWQKWERASERIICLQGMLKLVVCDRREGSPTSGEVKEIFLGEYRPREVIVPPGALRGWKAVGERPALVLALLQGESGEGARLSQDEAGVPYEWEIVMQ